MDACRKTILPRQGHMVEIFSRYLITSHTLHPSILEGVRRKVTDKGLDAAATWNISTYIEKLITDMLNKDEKYEVIKERMIERHVRELEREGSGATYLRNNLEANAVQLTYRDPNYIGAKQGNGHVKDETFRSIKSYNMKSLLLIIVDKAGFEADLNEIYTRRIPREKIENIDPHDIMTEIENTIDIRETRITQREGSQIYKTREIPRKRNTTQKSSQSTLDKLVRELEEMKSSRNKPKRSKLQTSKQKRYADLGFEQPTGKNSTPLEKYEFPCTNCKQLPGTEDDKKATCHNTCHCRYHGGQYMCTLAPKCKQRTSKIGVMNRLKREDMPNKLSVRKAAEIYHFKEEDLDKITEEDLKQPCYRGKKCPQEEDVGNHTRACKVEIQGQKERPPGCTWEDVVHAQEAFNASPSEWTLHQRRNRYNHEDRVRNRRHREEDEDDEEDDEYESEYSEEEDEDEDRDP